MWLSDTLSNQHPRPSAVLNTARLTLNNNKATASGISPEIIYPVLMLFKESKTKRSKALSSAHAGSALVGFSADWLYSALQQKRRCEWDFLAGQLSRALLAHAKTGPG
jgi:hypothetical protein